MEIKGKFSEVNSEIAVRYTPKIYKRNDPLITGSNIAIQAIHPAKNRPIALKIVNVVMGSAVLSGLNKAVIATRIAATINKTMCLPSN